MAGEVRVQKNLEVFSFIQTIYNNLLPAFRFMPVWTPAFFEGLQITNNPLESHDVLVVGISPKLGEESKRRRVDFIYLPKHLCSHTYNIGHGGLLS